MNMKFIKLFSILLLVFVFCGCVAAADIEVSDCDSSAVSSNTTITVHTDDNGINHLTIKNTEDNKKINSVSDGNGTPVPHAHVYVDSEDMNETPHDQFVNESFTFNIEFSNVGDAVGYQPIMELVVPKEIEINDHSFLGTNITMTNMGMFTAINGFIVKDTFTNKTVVLNESYENATLYVIHLPLGSYTPQEPATTVKMGAYIKGDIPLDLINMLVTPIFRFGSGYIDDPEKYPPIYGDNITAYVQPEIVRVNKGDNAPENERSTGPNFNYTYTVNVDIANGKDINNIIITDHIPTQLVYAGDLHLNYHNTPLIEGIDYEIVDIPSADKTGGDLKIKFLRNFTGAEGVADLTLSYVVWAPRFDNSTGENQYIINPETGGVNVTNNTVEVTCDHNSTYGNYSFNVNASDNVTLKSLAIQKDLYSNGQSVAGGEVLIGDILTYIINFQVSDYFSLTDFVLNDTPLHAGLGAGQVFINDSVYLNLMGKDYHISSDYYTVSPEKTAEGGDYTYFRVVVRVSDFLKDNGIDNLTGSLNISDDLGDAVVGNVRFDVNVTAFYENATNGTSVSSQDRIINTATMESKLTSNHHEVNDSSVTNCVIRVPTISKAIIAINNDTSRNSSDINKKIRVNPGDNVTFLIDAYIANSVDGFTLSDFLPTPLFNINSFVKINSTKGEIPLVNHWSYTNDSEIPHDKEGNVIEPEVEVRPNPNNELYFRYGNIFDEDKMFHFKIMITVEASNAQFADELYLTNLVGMTYQDSLNQTYHNETIVGFVLNEPELTINKTVELLDKNIGNCFQGETIANYTVEITNIGHYNAFDVIICDDYLDLGVGEVLDLTFVYKNGTVVNLTQDKINDFFNTSKGYYVGDLPWVGEDGTVCNSFKVIYTVKFNEKTQPGHIVTNKANITNFASIINGPNFATNKEKYSDDENVTAALVNMNKTFVGSDDYDFDFGFLNNETKNQTPNIRKQNLTIGELGVFNVTITIPNLNLTNVTIVDVIDEYLEIPEEVPGSKKYMVYLIDNITNTHLVGTYTTEWQSSEHRLTITCDGTFVPINGADVAHEITFMVYYVVSNQNWEYNIKNVTNRANFTLHTGNMFFNETTNTTYEIVVPYSASADVILYQPQLNISKTYNESVVVGGDALNFNITVQNIGLSPSFDTTIIDDLSDLIENFVLNGKDGLTWTFSGNSSAVDLIWDDKIATIKFHRLNPDEIISVRCDFIVKDDVVIGINNTNIGISNGESTPADMHNQTKFYEVRDDDIVATKNLIIIKDVFNSTIDNGKDNVTIGENVTYNMTITVEKGNYPYLIFNDVLPEGFRYVNNSIVIVCNGTVLSDGDKNKTEWYNITISDDGKVIRIDFNNDFAQYIIENGGLFNVNLTATVLNVSSNNASAKNITKTNFVEFQWYNHVINDTADVYIVEPIVNITKNFNVQTNVSGGDKLYFDITVKNTGNSFLFNTTIIDDLSELIKDFINETTLSCYGSDNYNNDTHILSYPIGQLNPGESKSFRVNFTVRYDVPIGYVYNNTANVTGYSVPIEGTDNLTNRFYTLNDTSIVDTKNLTINKTVNSSTINIGSNGKDNATIGEHITYNMTVTVVTGNYTALNITDKLPNGFRYDADSVKVICEGVELSPTESGVEFYEVRPIDDVTVIVVFTNNFAQYIINHGGIFTVQLNATVLNVSYNNGSAKNRTKINNVDLEWNNGNKDHSSANVTIVEPAAEIIKEFNVNTNVSGKDDLYFNLTVKNTGETPLFNTTIIDDLSKLVEEFIDNETIVVYRWNGVDWEIMTSSLPDNILYIPVGQLDVNQTEIFQVRFTVRPDVPVTKTYNNTANVIGYSVPFDGTNVDRIYSNNSTDSVDMANVTIEKSVYNTSIPDNGKDSVATGENVTYNITVNLVIGNYTSIVLNDTLPAGFEYINGSIKVYDQEGELIPEIHEGTRFYTVIPGENNTSVRIDFTNEFAQYVFEVGTNFTVFLNATRLNTTNVGTVNVANITWDGRSANATANITLVNPDVVIDKEFSNKTNICGGDQMYFNLTIKNNGTSPLYDIVIEDNLTDFIAKLSNRNSIHAYYSNGTEILNPIDVDNVLRIKLGFLNFTSGQNSITFKVNFTVKEDVYIGSSFTNYANVSGYSVPSEGLDVNHTKRYDNKDEDTLVTEDLPIVKTVINTTINNGAFNVTVGENITYNLTVTVVEGNYSALNITDTLPDGFEYVDGSVLVYIGDKLINDSTGLYEVLPVTGNVVVIVFTNDFAQKVINATGTPSNNNTFTVLLNATVLDESIINRTTGIKTNLAELRWNEGKYSNSTANVTIVEPDVNITKKFNKTTEVSGRDVISFIINVTNNGSSPLFNTTIVDDLSDLISGYIIDGNHSKITITYADGSAVPEGVISWNGSILSLNVGELGYVNNTSVAFKLTFTVKDDVIIGSKYTNVANVTGYSAPFNGTDEHNRAYSRIAKDSFETAKPVIAKNVTVDNVTIGEEVTYTLNVTLPIGLYENLTIIDSLPEGFNFTGAVYYNNGSTIPAEYDETTRKITFEFLNLHSVDFNNRILINLIAEVLNSDVNHNGDKKVNNVDLYSNGTFCNNDTANVTLIEPSITIEKVANGERFNVTESVQYNITVKNTGTSPAYLVNVTDVLNETLVVDHYDDVEGWTIHYDNETRTLSMYNPYFAEGSSVTFVVVCNFTKDALGKNITNTANVTANSVNDPNKGRNYTNSSNDTVYVVVVDVEVTKICTSDVVAGQEVDYEVNVTNKGPDTAFNVTLYELFDSSKLYNVSYKIAGTANWIPIEYNGTVSLGDLSKDQKVIIQVKGLLKSDALGILNNTVKVTTDTNESDYDNNNDTNLTNITTKTEIDVLKVSNETKVIRGNNISYVITVTIKGPSDARNVTLWDTFDTTVLLKMEYSLDNVTWTAYTNGTVIELGNMSAGSSKLVYFRTNVNPETHIETAINTVNITTETDHNGTNTSTNVTPIIVVADINITKVANVTDVNPGELVNYTINVSASGISYSTNVTLTDVLNTTYLDGSNALYSVDGVEKGSWTGTVYLGTMTPGQSIIVVIYNIKVKDVDYTLTNRTIPNVARVTSYELNGTYKEDDANITVNLVDVAVEKNMTTGNYRDNITFTINVTNNGPNSTSNVTVKDLLPTYLIYQNHTASNGNEKYNPLTGIWTIGDIAVGQVFTLTITCTINKTGFIENNVTVETYTGHDTNMSNNNDTVNDTVPLAIDLAIDKVVDSYGNYTENITYNITVINNGPDNGTGIFVIDKLPKGIYFLEANNTNVVDNGDGTFTWTIGNLTVGESVSIQVICSINTTGNVTNYANVTGNEYDWNLTNNYDNVTVEIPPAIDLAIVKDVVEFGNFTENITYIINVTNNGPNNATGVIVNDLPDGVFFLNATEGAEIIDNGDGTFSWVIGDLNVGEYVYIYVTCSINATGNVTNFVNVSGNEFEWNWTNNYDNVTVEIPPAIDLAVDKEVDSYGNYTENIVYTIVVTNNGPNDATGVVVIDKLPKGIVFISADSSNVVDNGDGTFTWTIGDLASSDSILLTVTCLINTTGNITNFVNVSGNEYEWNWTNNYDNVTVEIPPAADLAVNKTANIRNVTVGDKVVYTIVVWNNGPDTAPNAYAIDKLPDGLKFVSYKASVGSYNPVTGIWTIGDLPVGKSVTLIITTIATKSGIIDNVVTVGSDAFDVNESNNIANYTIEVKDVQNSNTNSNLISMERTGAPLFALVLVILLFAIGITTRSRWRK